ncbi:hypothetical protein [Micromonospora sp. NPDC001898]|uniref:hypothetical protein n=1 Tax=Micromonospora sp. NPDC001898 TaxID=3364221 RepID=UPI003676F095
MTDRHHDPHALGGGVTDRNGGPTDDVTDRNGDLTGGVTDRNGGPTDDVTSGSGEVVEAT